MATVADSDTGRPSSIDHSGEGALARLGLRFTNLAEHWFPDAYVFVCLAVAVVAAAAMLNGAAPMAVAKSFGDGFWSLITFTMQMAIVAIGGYVVASSPPAAKLIDGLAAMPRSGAGAVAFVAAVSMLTSLLSWGLSLIFSGLLVRVLARRSNLHMDYRAAGATAVTAQMMDVDLEQTQVTQLPKRKRPGEWLEYSPLLTLIVAALGGGWIKQEVASKDPILAISNLNTYNLLFLMLGMLLHWRPRSFLNSVAKAVPATAGVLIQFPLYGGIATIMTGAKGFGDHTLADQIAHAFVSLTTTGTFPGAMGIFSAVLGFFIPSGGGKWIIEAPYVMQAANDLKVHLGWAVQIYNTAEALPNLIL